MECTTSTMAVLLGLIVLWSFGSKVLGQSYSDVYQLQEDLFQNYSTTIRPLLNQSDKMSISPLFALIAIAEVNEVEQKIVVNGFLGMVWHDELLSWNPSSYNGISRITPDPQSIWRPRVVLLNTMDERDLFEDDYAPVNIDHAGMTSWFPGGLFPALCLLDLRKFPFDQHVCPFNLSPMSMNASDMNFDLNSSSVNQELFIENGEWTLKGASASVLPMVSQNVVYNVLRIELTIQRKATFFIINIFFPVVFLGALNAMTFLIPVDSGEKISYSIAVLLAMAVYMEVVGELMPTNSENMPYMSHYIFYLFSLSVLCCVATIAIVWLHHKEEEVEKKQKRQSKLKGMLSKLNAMTSFKSPADKAKIVPEAEGPPDASCVLAVMGKSGNDVDASSSARCSQAGDYKQTTLTSVAPHGTNADKAAIHALTSRMARASATVASGHLNTTSIPPEIRFNRYKNMADKLNFYSGIGFMIASIIITCVILILILS